MITRDKICKEIEDTLEHGRMSSQCVADLMALYYLRDKLDGTEHRQDVNENMSLNTAREWTRHMKNADGSTGEHWTIEQTNKVMRDKNYSFQPAEFYAAMNMLWSDYSKVAEKFGVNNVDFWATMSQAFLADEDARPKKLERYYSAIVEKNHT